MTADGLRAALCRWTDVQAGEEHGPWCADNADADALLAVVQPFIERAVTYERTRCADIAREVDAADPCPQSFTILTRIEDPDHEDSDDG